MTSKVRAGATPAHVAGAATQKSALPMQQLTLIGLFGPASAPRALLRGRNGRILKVEPGDRVGGSHVMGIDSDGVILQRQNQAVRLALPSK
ncbi:hypothetical protein [Pontibaca salina]|uniref:Pilus assembly protein PilP n=1 Tax=Pontibaca salina TaxID=2795731 RepID=A0A934LYT8_9RHOB|nr:hypothetical protein [Pontibaca salina]MBI6630147.1 hypothetical protein [Pontibaca salina]